MGIDFPARIMNRIPDFVAYVDSDLRYRYTNESYQNVLGRSAEDLVGRSILEVLPAKTIELAKPKMEAALAGEEVEFDSQLQGPDEEVKWLAARYIPDRAPGGSVRGFFAILTDVTARKEAELKLQRVKDLCDGLPTLLAHCDTDERYLFVNQAYAETYGRTREEVIGRRIPDILPPPLYEQIQPYVRTLLAGRPVDFEMPRPMPDGSEAWIAVGGVPVFHDSEITGFYVNISDVSKRKELEKLRREFAAGIVQAQEAERKALAQELHDGIAQELAALAVFSDMLPREPETPQGETPGVRIHEGLHRTVAEIRRLSHGLHPLELSELGLIGAVEEFLTRTRNAHHEVEIELDRDGLQEGFSLGGDGDIAVYRIVQEAIGNALRHGAPARIELRFQLANECFSGSITDDGSGFELGAKPGGLGLRSMRERTAMLDGTFRIVSGIEGSSVEFSIPAGASSAG